MATYAFSGGTTAVSAYGDRWLLGFSGTWVLGETWSFELISPTLGNIMVGVGNLGGLAATCGLNFKNRVFAGLGTRFAFSDNEGPTAWEEQDPGAGFVAYLSNFGSQDTIGALSTLQGRLAVLARQSIQLWETNADPSGFSLIQVLDNIGTRAPLSVHQLGDLDVLFLDDTGIRSLRAREVTLNAFIDDLGLPIDNIIQPVLAAYDASPACGIVEPATKRYMLFIQDTVYVLSIYRGAKITAWSTWKTTYQTASAALVPNSLTYNANKQVTFTVVAGSTYKFTLVTEAATLVNGTDTIVDGGYFVASGTTVTVTTTAAAGATVTCLVAKQNQTAFTPEKFVAYNGRVYVRDTAGKVYLYGGTSGTQYDTSVPTVVMPWFDKNSPTTIKQAHGFDASFAGRWTFSGSMDPSQSTVEAILTDGSTSSPDEGSDSSFGKGAIPYQAIGTHFYIKAVGAALPTSAELSSITIKYKDQGVKL